MISRHPATKKTATMSMRNVPVISPLGANSSLNIPAGPVSRSAQKIQQPKNTSAIASVRFRSAFAPRNSG